MKRIRELWSGGKIVRHKNRKDHERKVGIWPKPKEGKRKLGWMYLDFEGNWPVV